MNDIQQKLQAAQEACKEAYKDYQSRPWNVQAKARFHTSEWNVGIWQMKLIADSEACSGFANESKDI